MNPDLEDAELEARYSRRVCALCTADADATCFLCERAVCVDDYKFMGRFRVCFECLGYRR